MESPHDHPLLHDLITRFFGEIGEPKEIHIPCKQNDTPISHALSFGEGKFLFITSINASTVAGMKHAVGSITRPKVLIVVKGGTRTSGDEKIPASWDVRKISEEQVTIDVVGHVLNGGSAWPWDPTAARLPESPAPSVRTRAHAGAVTSGLAIVKVDDPLVVQLVGKLGDCVQVETLPVVAGGDSRTFLAVVKR